MISLSHSLNSIVVCSAIQRLQLDLPKAFIVRMGLTCAVTINVILTRNIGRAMQVVKCFAKEFDIFSILRQNSYVARMTIHIFFQCLLYVAYVYLVTVFTSDFVDQKYFLAGTTEGTLVVN